MNLHKRYRIGWHTWKLVKKVPCFYNREPALEILEECECGDKRAYVITFWNDTHDINPDLFDAKWKPKQDKDAPQETNSPA